MNKNKIIALGCIIASCYMVSCAVPKAIEKTNDTPIPTSYNGSIDSSNVAKMAWSNFFNDKN